MSEKVDTRKLDAVLAECKTPADVQQARLSGR
jgi:cAMP phosphodiesterase